MCLIHADFKHFHQLKTKRFSNPPQGLVNHAGECRAGDAGLTSLFKRFRTRLG
jgi:hypothetical protein